MTERSRNLLINLGLFLASVGLYVLSFPMGGFDGLPILAFIALVPLGFWLGRHRLPWMLPAGAAYGALVYAIGCYWLYNYYPAALFLAMAVAVLRFAPLFLAVKLCTGRRYGFVAIPVLWAAADTISSIGFLAFPYLTLPYALYRSGPALFTASLGGMSMLSLLVAAVNGLLFLGIRRWLDGRQRGTAPYRPAILLPLLVAGLISLAFMLPPRASVSDAAGRELILLADRSQAPAPGYARVALVQPDNPHPQTSHLDYQLTLNRLKALSDQVRDEPIDLLVWHETAVVPAIGWHLRFRQPQTVYEVTRDAHDYLAAYPFPVILGNGWSPDNEERRRVRHNSAILYQHGREDQMYAKMKLVPFSEHFPYGRLFPRLSDWLERMFNYFWTAGTEFTVFDTGSLRFAAPICFEDSFGPHFIAYQDLDFYVVLTQDSWAKADAMQKQHKSMSVFRAAESGAIVLRVGNSGYTAAILPNGAIAATLPSFTADVLVVDVLKGWEQPTVYKSLGKHFDSLVLGLAGLAIALSLGLKLLRPLLDKKSGL